MDGSPLAQAAKQPAPPFPADTAKPEERFANAEFEINQNIKIIKTKYGSEPSGIGDMAQATVEEYTKNPTKENLELVESASEYIKLAKDDPQQILKIAQKFDKKSKK